MSFCVAFGCNNNWKNKKPEITFHRFPKDPGKRQLWINAVKRKNWMPHSKSVLCSIHFKEEFMDRTSRSVVRLRDGAVPTIFPAYPSYLQPKESVNEIPMRTSPEVGSQESPSDPCFQESLYEDVNHLLLCPEVEIQECLPEHVNKHFLPDTKGIPINEGPSPEVGNQESQHVDKHFPFEANQIPRSKSAPPEVENQEFLFDYVNKCFLFEETGIPRCGSVPPGNQESSSEHNQSFLSETNETQKSAFPEVENQETFSGPSSSDLCVDIKPFLKTRNEKKLWDELEKNKKRFIFQKRDTRNLEQKIRSLTKRITYLKQIILDLKKNAHLENDSCSLCKESAKGFPIEKEVEEFLTGSPSLDPCIFNQVPLESPLEKNLKIWLEKMKKTIILQRRNIQRLQQSVRRLTQRVSNLKEIIIHFKKKFILENDSCSLFESIADSFMFSLEKEIN